ncbi:hypothetical protein CCUS01_13447 [Colletotrichum cuscutae]|uniref:Uncharacterized protein n=1 Tax=Colletotrichum cuscutae TaxID=1209917 RepID=A0AAI9YBL2_9PEZI|nr:hypothetical protein CCUS01_13447 [Colletotrichum cuscutae]
MGVEGALLSVSSRSVTSVLMGVEGALLSLGGSARGSFQGTPRLSTMLEQSQAVRPRIGGEPASGSIARNPDLGWISTPSPAMLSCRDSGQRASFWAARSSRG